jgi:hypothetical protein
MTQSRAVVLAAPVRTVIGIFGSLADMPGTRSGAVASAQPLNEPGSDLRRSARSSRAMLGRREPR